MKYLQPALERDQQKGSQHHSLIVIMLGAKRLCHCQPGSREESAGGSTPRSTCHPPLVTGKKPRRMTLSAAISDGQGAAVVVDDAEVGVRNRRGGFFTKNQILSVSSRC